MVGARVRRARARPAPPDGLRTTSAPLLGRLDHVRRRRGSSWCSTSIRTPPGGPWSTAPAASREPCAPVTTAGGWLRATGDPAAGLASLGVDGRAPIRTGTRTRTRTGGARPAPAAAPEGWRVTAAGPAWPCRWRPWRRWPRLPGWPRRSNPGSACGARRRTTIAVAPSDEADLVERARAGDVDAYADLLAAHQAAAAGWPRPWAGRATPTRWPRARSSRPGTASPGSVRGPPSGPGCCGSWPTRPATAGGPPGAGRATSCASPPTGPCPPGPSRRPRPRCW